MRRSPRTARPPLGLRPNMAHPQAAGLVFCCPFAEGSGPNATDAVGGRVLSGTGPPTWAPSRFGMVPSLNGTSQYYSTAAPAVSAAPCTMTCWFWTTSTATTNVGLVCTEGANSVSNLFIDLLLDTSTQKVVVRSTSSDAARSTGLYPTGTWVHAAGVYAATNDRRAYWNGGNKGTNSTASGTPNGLLATNVGASTSGGGFSTFFPGLIYDVRVYNRALSDAEVYAVYANPFAIWPGARRRWTQPAAGGGGRVRRVSFEGGFSHMLGGFTG